MGGRNRIFGEVRATNRDGAETWVFGRPAGTTAGVGVGVALAGPITAVDIYRLAYEQARAAVAGAVFYEKCVMTHTN